MAGGLVLGSRSCVWLGGCCVLALGSSTAEPWLRRCWLRRLQERSEKIPSVLPRTVRSQVPQPVAGKMMMKGSYPISRQPC